MIVVILSEAKDLLGTEEILRSLRSLRTTAAAALLAAPLWAQDTTARTLPAVQVTRDRARSPLELPYAISATRPDSVSPGQIHTLPEQTLFLLPGITVANRTNPSQDARISIRGFGARSPFGVRSLRVLRDGMPLTMPDGQTPLDYLDLEAVGTVETIRGSASSLYGNASGGVIDLRSQPPPAAKVAAQLREWYGSNATHRQALMFGGTTTHAWYQGNIGATTSDGSRGTTTGGEFQSYSRQKLRNGFLRAGSEWRGTQITLTAMGLDMPTANNPGALTRIQFDTNPEMADPQSITKKARKAVDQLQAGLQARRHFGDGNEIHAQYFNGWRTLDNPLAFSTVGIDRITNGLSVRYTRAPAHNNPRHLRLTVGGESQRLSDARKNWANCNGLAVPTAACPTINVDRGNRTLDQREIVMSVGSYGRVEAELGAAHATAGVRYDQTQFELSDKFTSDGRDDSGDRRMSAWSPMVGVAVRLRPEHMVYFNVSTAFETPTTTEMVNKPDSSAGLNPALSPQSSRTAEFGFKGVAFERFRFDAAIFATNVQDELIPFDIGSGRTAFRNAGRTRRRGAEGSLSATFGRLAMNGVWTYSDFTFRDFLSGTTQYAGNTIPGVPKQQMQLSASYRARHGFALVEWIAKDKIQVNDANAVAAPGFALLNVRAGGAFSRGRLTPVIGVQNLLDRKYVSSVAVNAAGSVTTGKFYEPGPGRTIYAGLTVATAPW